jgi:Zn-dependent protease
MRGWRIGRILGIDIELDLSWFLILALMIYALGFLEFPNALNPHALRPRADWLSITLGIITSLLLFGSVLAHELSHSWMAIQRGIVVKRITLFIFGGVAQIAGEPDKPLSEFLIAIMGPLMSLALAAIFGGISMWLSIIDSLNLIDVSFLPITLILGILAQANGTLALFNLAPGFPLDGGRVFRSILWGWTKNIQHATLWASRAGQFIAVLLVASSGVMYWQGFGIGGLWNVLIGFFLWNAATDGYRQTMMIEALRRVTVRDVMTTTVESIDGNLSLNEFVEAYLLHRREQTFVVSDGVTFQGTIGIDQVRNAPREQWINQRVRDAMMPRTKIQTIDPNASGADALARLGQSESAELVVIVEDQVVGFIGQAELSRYLKLKRD